MTGVLIPKPGSSGKRTLAIAAVRDRIVQAAVKIVLEPVFEADFLPCSFGLAQVQRAHHPVRPRSSRARFVRRDAQVTGARGSPQVMSSRCAKQAGLTL